MSATTDFVSLPTEIKITIISLLSQYDCNNLLKTCKSLHNLATPRLYQNIIVDENYNHFSNENIYNLTYNQEMSCTYINNQHSLKRFIKTVNDESHCYKYHIKKFQVYRLPKSLNIYELYPDLAIFFSKLFGLTDLIWNDSNFNSVWLHNIPEKHSLKKLCFFLKDKLQKFPYFPNLEFFQYEPFSLKTLPKNLSNNLSSLILSKDRVSNCLLPNCYDLSVRSAEITHIHTKYYDIDLKSISNIVSNISYLNLSKLSLNNVLITNSDADLLSKSINLSNLNDLNLNNISEYQILNSPHHFSFLISLVPHLTNLKNLSLDYRQQDIDSIPEFLSQLNEHKLKSLDLVIRLNQTKNIGDGYDLYNDYGSIILGFKNLTKLSIEMKREVDNIADATNFHLLADFPENLDFISQLHTLADLSSLRVNPNKNIDNLLDSVTKMDKLRYLDLFGSKAGISPSLGLGMVHPSVYDDWYKVQHVANKFNRRNSKINYIQVSDCVFECSKSNVIPRKGYDEWFKGKVRVQ